MSPGTSLRACSGASAQQVRLARDHGVHGDARRRREAHAPIAVDGRVRERRSAGPRTLEKIRENIHGLGRSHMDRADSSMESTASRRCTGSFTNQGEPDATGGAIRSSTAESTSSTSSTSSRRRPATGEVARAREGGGDQPRARPPSARAACTSAGRRRSRPARAATSPASSRRSAPGSRASRSATRSSASPHNRASHAELVVGRGAATSRRDRAAVPWEAAGSLFVVGTTAVGRGPRGVARRRRRGRDLRRRRRRRHARRAARARRRRDRSSASPASATTSGCASTARSR